MKKHCTIVFLILTISGLFAGLVNARHFTADQRSGRCPALVADTVLYPEAMHVITTAINASASFNIDAVANLYTPNAVVADEEPPFAWNGPTAGIQWVNAIEKTCKDLRISRLKISIKPVSVFQQTDESVYVVVPVDYRGYLPDEKVFEEKGAFTFVLRIVSGKWLIKSQAWMPKKGM